jgi:four helix bundle protein
MNDERMSGGDSCNKMRNACGLNHVQFVPLMAFSQRWIVRNRTGADRAHAAAMKGGRLAELTDEAAMLTVAFVKALPNSQVHYKLGGQLLDSGTSQAANYRAAQRARSPADFVAKLKIVEEEADESVMWVDRLQDAGIPSDLATDAARLRNMLEQIVALTVQSIKTTRLRHLQSTQTHRQR